MIGRRIFDVGASVTALAVLSPVLLLVAAAIRLDSPGPVFFRQERVGLNGRIFRIHKFRTMFHSVGGSGPALTISGDARITRVGAFLRRHKIDELAQLIDVALGNMAFVGPRPELARYVALYPEDVRRVVLSVRPGLTDVASIEYRDEGSILSASDDPETTYINVVMPAKLRLSAEYIKSRSFLGDMFVIARTLAAIVAGAATGNG